MRISLETNFIRLWWQYEYTNDRTSVAYNVANVFSHPNLIFTSSLLSKLFCCCSNTTVCDHSLGNGSSNRCHLCDIPNTPRAMHAYLEQQQQQQNYGNQVKPFTYCKFSELLISCVQFHPRLMMTLARTICESAFEENKALFQLEKYPMGMKTWFVQSVPVVTVQVTLILKFSSPNFYDTNYSPPSYLFILQTSKLCPNHWRKYYISLQNDVYRQWVHQRRSFWNVYVFVNF